MNFQKTSGTFGLADSTWAITEEVKQKSIQYFKSIDVQNSGFIDSNTAKYFFSLSGLSNAEIVKIWSISHISKDQKLDFCRFQVVMALVLAKLSGKGIPDQLPAPFLELININNGSNFTNTLPSNSSIEFTSEDSFTRNVLQEVPSNYSGSDASLVTEMMNRTGGPSENMGDIAKQLGNINIAPPQMNTNGSNDTSSFIGFNQSMPTSGQNLPEKLSASVPTTADYSKYENVAVKDVLETPVFTNTIDPKNPAYSDSALLATTVHQSSSRQQADESSSRSIQSLDALSNVDSYMVTPEQLSIYDKYFKCLDEKNVGLLSKEAVRTFSNRLGLPDSVFTSVWTIADVNRDLQFSNREFYIFLHLVNLWRRGYKLPTQLPQQLVNSLGMSNINANLFRKSLESNYQKNLEADSLDVQKHDAKISNLTREKEALMQEIRQLSVTNASKTQKFEQIDQKNQTLRQNAIAIEIQVESTRNKIMNISNLIIEAESYLLTLTRQMAHMNSLLMQKQSQRESERAALLSFHEKLRHMILSLVKQTEESAQTKVNT